MARALIVSGERDTWSPLLKGLTGYDVTGSFTSSANGVTEAVAAGRPDAVVLDIEEGMTSADIRSVIRRVKRVRSVAVIAVISPEMLPDIELPPEVDDFIVSPCGAAELAVRVLRLMSKKSEEKEGEDIIHRDGMSINLTTCDVKVDGTIIDLTFKEYELLKFLAGNPGRVYTREALLDKVWGMDYFGGDRTVDVHIRRLRSKIESTGHDFIETVRNIGYRFKAD